MKTDFKRFLSAVLSLIMTFSALTIGNVSSAYADDTATTATDVVTVGDGKTFDLQESIIGSSTSGSIDGLTYSASDINGTKGIYLKYTATNFIKFTPDVDCTVAITCSNNSIDVKQGDTVLKTIKKTTDSIDATANTEYTIVTSSDNSNGGVSQIVFTPKGGSSGDTETTFTVSTSLPDMSVVGTIYVTNDDTGEQTESSGSYTTTGNGASFTITYDGPDYTMNPENITCDLTTPNQVVDMSKLLTPIEYSVSGEIEGDVNGVITVGGIDATVADGKYTATGVTYWNNGEKAKITYTPDDGSSMSDVDITGDMQLAYDSKTKEIVVNLTITPDPDATTTTETTTETTTKETTTEVVTSAPVSGGLAAGTYTLNKSTSVDGIDTSKAYSPETSQIKVRAGKGITVTPAVSGTITFTWSSNTPAVYCDGVAVDFTTSGSDSTFNVEAGKTYTIEGSSASNTVLTKLVLASGGSVDTTTTTTTKTETTTETTTKETTETTTSSAKGIIDLSGKTADSNGGITLNFGTSQDITKSGDRNVKIVTNNKGTATFATSKVTLKGGSSTASVDDAYIEFIIDKRYQLAVETDTTTAKFDIVDVEGNVVDVTQSSKTVTANLPAGTYRIRPKSANVNSSVNIYSMTFTELGDYSYKYRVDKGSLSLNGNFVFKDANGNEITDAVEFGTVIYIYYDNDDYKFTGGYTTIKAGVASTAVTIENTTDASIKTMVLDVSKFPGFSKTIGTTSVKRETVTDTPTYKEWIYRFQSGTYNEGYLPISDLTPDPGVINTSTVAGYYGDRDEAYMGNDTKNTQSSSPGQNNVLVTPGVGAELIDTDGDDKNGKITTLYMPLPQDIDNGRVTVRGSVSTSTAKKQWTLMQVGDVGGLRTSGDSSPVYGLRLGNGSSTNNSYNLSDAENTALESKLWNVTSANKTAITASAGTMEYELIVDYDAMTITLSMGDSVVTSSFADVPEGFRNVGYVKTMTETKYQRNINVYDTTIIWEPKVTKTTATVNLDVLNQTTKAYTAVIYDVTPDANTQNDGIALADSDEEVGRVAIDEGAESNTDYVSNLIGELPVGNYQIVYLYHNTDASTIADISTFDFDVTQEDVDAGTKTVQTIIKEPEVLTPTINVTVTNKSLNGTYPAKIYLVDANGSKVSEATVNYDITGAGSEAGVQTTWTIENTDIPTGTYSFAIEDDKNLVAYTDQVVTIVDGTLDYTGAVTVEDIPTQDTLVPVPWNDSDKDYYIFGTGNNSDGGVYNGNHYFGYDTSDTSGFTTDATHLIFPKTGDNEFIFTPENDSKLEIKINAGFTFSPSLYTTSDMSESAVASSVSTTGTFTYYVKGGTTYILKGLSNKTSQLQKLQLRPFTAVSTVKVQLDATNKLANDVTISVRDINGTYLEEAIIKAGQATYDLTGAYTPGNSYTFRVSTSGAKIESYEFSIPEDQTGTYTAKLVLGTESGLHIVLRNAPSSYTITFNGTATTYTTTDNDHTFDVVAGTKYKISFSNEGAITKWPTYGWFEYDKTDKSYYVKVPSDYDGSATLYFDYTSNASHTLYTADNSTSQSSAPTLGFGEWGFGEEKAQVTGNDARTVLQYAGVVPSLTDFKGSYEYAIRDSLNLGYHLDGDDTSTSLGYKTSRDSAAGTPTVLGNNRNTLVINGDTDSYIQFVSENSGLCMVDKSMRGIVVAEDGTTISTTTSSNGNYVTFPVTAGKTYKITGDTKTSNTQIKSIRIFPKDNILHFENLQSVGQFGSVSNMEDKLKTNGNVSVTAEAGIDTTDNVFRLLGYVEKDKIADPEVFDNVAYVGWTFVDKDLVDTYEGIQTGVDYNPNMTLAQTTVGEFEGIDPDDFKDLHGTRLYEQVYDYSVEPTNNVYEFQTDLSSNGPFMLRHIAASSGTSYYAYPYTVYKDDLSRKAYTLATDETYGKNGSNVWRSVITF